MIDARTSFLKIKVVTHIAFSVDSITFSIFPKANSLVIVNMPNTLENDLFIFVRFVFDHELTDIC